MSMTTDSNNHLIAVKLICVYELMLLVFAFTWYVDGHGAAKFLSNFRNKIFSFRISYIL